MTGAEAGFGAFGVQTVFDVSWPSGPAWFVTVLFGCDVVAVAARPLFGWVQAAVWGLSANAYGIYLVHYVFVVWGQYVLLGWAIGAVPKALLVFGGALGLSWGSSARFRQARRSVVGFG